MITKEMRNDIMYGQNWVEQFRSARRSLGYIPISWSNILVPSHMVGNLFNATESYRLDWPLWERRKQKFMTHESERIYYALID